MNVGDKYVVAIHPNGTLRIIKVYDTFMKMWEYRMQKKRKFWRWTWWEYTGDYGFGSRYVDDWCTMYDLETVKDWEDIHRTGEQNENS